MKAEIFVKKHGLNHARQVLSNADSGANKYVIDFNFYAAGIVTDDYVLLSELSRVINSHELVQVHGLEQSKEIVKNAPSDDHFYSWTLGNSGVRDKTVNIGELRKAIEVVEACQ